MDWTLEHQPIAQQQPGAQQQPLAQQPVAEQPITDWHDYKAVSHKFDCLDYLIEMHGRIMGISLSPCHRYYNFDLLTNQLYELAMISSEIV